MADLKPWKPAPPAGSKPVGVPVYHDYRQGRTNEADCCRTERPACPPPPVGAGKGFTGS